MYFVSSPVLFLVCLSSCYHSLGGLDLTFIFCIMVGEHLGSPAYICPLGGGAPAFINYSSLVMGPPCMPGQVLGVYLTPFLSGELELVLLAPNLLLSALAANHGNFTTKP